MIRMKNTFTAVGILFVLAIGLMACVRGKGDVVLHTYEATGFTKIDHNIKGDMVLVKDSSQFVEVSTQQNIHDILDISVDGGTLKIRTKAAKSISSYEELKFYVHTPFVDYIRLAGSGTITADTGIVGSDFSCKIINNGRIELTSLDLTHIEVIISGAGSVKLQGTCDNSEFGVGSAGRVEAFDLQSAITDVQLKGNGSIETWTDVKLTVFISGTGGVYFKGDPEVNQTITGNGVLVKVD